MVFFAATGMNKLEYDIDVYGKPHHIEVTNPFGSGGNTYHVMIDKRYCGQIVPRPGGLQPYVEPGEVLTGDDLSVIIDQLEGRQ